MKTASVVRLELAFPIRHFWDKYIS